MALLPWIVLLCSAVGSTNTIAFVDQADTPTSQVCVVNVESGDTVAIGPGVRDGAPQWSPDGSWLAFETGERSARAIYVVRADGTDGRQLQHQKPWNVMPRWSTDCTRLVYMSATSPGGLGSLAVYDLHTGEEHLWGAGALGLLRPVWMPFSKLMRALDPDVLTSVTGMNIDVFRREARMERKDLDEDVLPEALLAIQIVLGGKSDPGIQTRAVLVTESEVLPFLDIALKERSEGYGALWQLEPNWEGARFGENPRAERLFGTFPLTRNGEASRLAYESNEGGDREIYVVGGKGKANVTNHRSADWNPVWSPGGRRLAFESFREVRRAIYTVFTDTALISPIEKGDLSSWSPSWSPDGEQMACISDREGGAGLYVVTLKGGKSTRISPQEVIVDWPVWRPESRE